MKKKKTGFLKELVGAFKKGYGTGLKTPARKTKAKRTAAKRKSPRKSAAR